MTFISKYLSRRGRRAGGKSKTDERPDFTCPAMKDRKNGKSVPCGSKVVKVIRAHLEPGLIVTYECECLECGHKYEVKGRVVM